VLGFFSGQRCVVLLFRMNIIIIVTNDLTTTTCFDLYGSFYVIHTLHFLTFSILKR
jgi:hypothetical protein